MLQADRDWKFVSAVLAREAGNLLGLAAPFLLPPGVHLAYQPVNAAWTVKAFGCGCPPLDGSRRFDANCFNGVLWLVVFTVLGAVILANSHKQSERIKPAVIGVGIPFLAAECLWFWGREMWF
jgi:hypothetical protein